MLHLGRFAFLFKTLPLILLSTNTGIPKSALAESNSTQLSVLQKAKIESTDFENLAAKIKPSIVVIESVDRVGQEGGRGTGFVVGSDGVIATNFHVIGENRSFKVRLADGTSFSPQAILGIDRENDLALIKINADGLPALQLGDSEQLSPGQAVFAIGNPLGYSHSVTRGVISAIRELELGDGRPMVQVAIPIEPGSSGSPTLDLDGRVVSILAIKSGGAIGFGIPVNQLKFLIQEQTPIPIEKWLTIGALDSAEWNSIMSGTWKQRAGVISAAGLGSGFGGRMLCLSANPAMDTPYELEVEVRLEHESGAAGLVFHSDGSNKHYGFYPTNESMRLTCFQGESVYSWNILKTVKSTAYNLGKWNKIRVKAEENGKISCFVNDQEVISLIDKSLTGGKVGLCKFRLPTAEFRNFKQGKRLPSSSISPETRRIVRKISKSLEKSDRLPDKDFESLVKLGDESAQALKDQVATLQKSVNKLKSLSKRISDRIRIDELANSLKHQDESSVDLLKSALLIARLENPNFDLESYLKKAQNIADAISTHFPQKATDEEKIKILAHQLFVEMGYHGSTHDYNHPSNSYMNEVMDDREGIPITLSVLFMELARRLDLKVSGLGLPGHFITMYKNDSAESPKEILIDAFAGKIVNRKQASDIIGYNLKERDFVPASKKDIITRMIRNLLHMSDEENTNSRILYINAILAIDPTDRYTRAMRAMHYYLNGNYMDAMSDIDTLISENPDSPELAPLLEIRNRLIERRVD